MSAYEFSIKQNDRRPSVIAQLCDHEGEPLDLSEAESVTFSMRFRGGDTVLNKAPATTSLDDDEVESLAVYAWADGDTDTVGVYLGEFEVTWSTGITQTFPDDGYIKITIYDDIA